MAIYLNWKIKNKWARKMSLSSAFTWCSDAQNNKREITKRASGELRICKQHWCVKQAYAGVVLWFTATQSKCEWQELKKKKKKSLFKRDFENQHYGGPTFTDPLHCWALFISPASGHLSFISHRDPVSRQSRCAQHLRPATLKQDFIAPFFFFFLRMWARCLSWEHCGCAWIATRTTGTYLDVKLGQIKGPRTGSAASWCTRQIGLVNVIMIRPKQTEPY